MSGNKQLVTSVQALAPPGESILGAFVGIQGARPGVEALTVLLFAAVLIITSNYWLAIAITAISCAAVGASRTFATIALTDRSVVVIDTGLRRRISTKSKVKRLNHNSIALPDVATGDPKVTVGSRSFWVRGSDQDEARRLAKIGREQST